MISRFNRRLKWHLNTLRSVPSRFFSVIYNLLKTYVFPWMSGKLSRFFPVMVSPLILRRFLGSSRLSAQPPHTPLYTDPLPDGGEGPVYEDKPEDKNGERNSHRVEDKK